MFCSLLGLACLVLPLQCLYISMLFSLQEIFPSPLPGTFYFPQTLPFSSMPLSSACSSFRPEWGSSHKADYFGAFKAFPCLGAFKYNPGPNYILVFGVCRLLLSRLPPSSIPWVSCSCITAAMHSACCVPTVFFPHILARGNICLPLLALVTRGSI